MSLPLTAVIGGATGRRAPPAWQPPAPGNLITYGTVDMLSEPNGTGVASWGEPIAFTQPTASAQPTKQADHVFFGADDSMASMGIPTLTTGSLVMFVDAADMVFGLPWVNANNDWLLLRFGSGALAFRVIDANNNQHTVTAPAGWNTGGAKTVCARYTPTSMSLVIGGTEVGSRVLPSPIKQSQNNYILGAGPGIVGKKKRFGIYDKFLSIAEINTWAES